MAYQKKDGWSGGRPRFTMTGARHIPYINDASTGFKTRAITTGTPVNCLEEHFKTALLWDMSFLEISIICDESRGVRLAARFSFHQC